MKRVDEKNRRKELDQVEEELKMMQRQANQEENRRVQQSPSPVKDFWGQPQQPATREVLENQGGDDFWDNS